MKPNNEMLYNLYSSNAEYQIKGGWRAGAYSMFGRWKWNEKDDDEPTMNSVTWTERKKLQKSLSR